MKKYLIVTLTALLLSGCGYKGYIIVRDNKADVVSVKKEGYYR